MSTKLQAEKVLKDLDKFVGDTGRFLAMCREALAEDATPTDRAVMRKAIDAFMAGLEKKDGNKPPPSNAG